MDVKQKKLAQRFDDAMRYQNAGNLAEAERRLRNVVAVDAVHSPALHCLALLVHRRGDADEALSLMQRAARGHDADATVFNNLANMLREADREDEAVAVYRQAVQHDPANLNAQFNLAGALLRSGDGAGAQAHFEHVLHARPGDLAALHGLGFAMLAQDDAAGAVTHFQRLVDRAPEGLGAHVNLCRALLDADRAAASLAAAQQALARFHDDLQLLSLQARAQTELGSYEQAEQSFRHWISIQSDEPEPHIGLVRALIEQHREAAALALCDEFIVRFPQLADGFAMKGVVLKNLGRTADAVTALERALAIDPSFDGAWNNLGMMEMDRGNMGRAQECFARALSLQADSAQALFNVIRTRRNGDEHRDELQHIEQLAAQSSRAVEDRVSLHFALGKAFDDLHEYDRAFAHYEQGNALKRRSAPFDAAAFQHWTQALQETFDEAFFRRTAGFGATSSRPVFIVGMPRSGTSLVEQILASHPQVFGADELPYIIDFSESLQTRDGSERAYPYSAAALDSRLAGELGAEYLAAIAALDADTRFVTDKMPSNFFHLGLIAAILPNARVIHCVREPMDSCFSNFIQLFGSLHYYSFSLQNVAVFFNAYRRIMAHWDKVLPLRVHTVSYETLLDEPRTQTQAMLDFLDLPFDEACVEFHRTQRVVSTASHWQVRQPIYHTSRQRWRRYAEHLRGLAADIGYAMDAAERS